MVLTNINTLRIGVALIFAAILAVTGCSGGSATATDVSRSGQKAHDDGERQLLLHFNGLDDLGSDYVYEGWLIADGTPYSTGRFSVDGGRPYTARFDVDGEVANNSSLFVLTIEPAVGDDPAPADTHYLAGAFKGASAKLSIGHGAALGSDFYDASGSFILATPSTGDPAEDYNLGIWWVNPGVGASLDLPVLPAGWAYEGWAVAGGVVYSTGRFLDAGMADSDGAGPTSGPFPGPPFPGQDFIDPPIDLLGGTAVITVEPEPDNSAAPFTLKPLVGPIPADLPVGTLSPMANNAKASNPTGTANIVGS
jgi:hypothetical protein